MTKIKYEILDLFNVQGTFGHGFQLFVIFFHYCYLERVPSEDTSPQPLSKDRVGGASSGEGSAVPDHILYIALISPTQEFSHRHRQISWHWLEDLACGAWGFPWRKGMKAPLRQEDIWQWWWSIWIWQSLFWWPGHPVVQNRIELIGYKPILLTRNESLYIKDCLSKIPYVMLKTIRCF